VKGREELIEHYMTLPYRIEIVKLPDQKGGGFMACLPQFGRMAIIGDGETVDEALSNLAESKRTLFETYLDEGVEIPEPDTFEDEFSGKFLLRIPKYLHRDLALGAKENNASLNSFATALLSSALYEHRTISAIQRFEAEIKMLRSDVCSLTYKMAPGVILLHKSDFEAYDLGKAA